MISAKGLITYCNSIHNSNAIYLWGSDGEVGTKELLDKKKKTYGDKNYNGKTVDLIEGKLCFDCSGFLTPISGANITAQAYYDKCVEKGAIRQIPKDKVCLIFRKEEGKIVHVAVYMGDGKLTEMWSGCDQRKFKESEWTYYGFPTWLEEQEDKVVVGGTVKITNEIKVYNNASDAKKGKSALPFTYPAGTYYIYKIHALTGTVNISKIKGTAGAWVMLP